MIAVTPIDLKQGHVARWESTILLNCGCSAIALALLSLFAREAQRRRAHSNMLCKIC